MDRIESKIQTSSPEFRTNREHMSDLVSELKERLVQAQLGGSEASRQRHKARGKLLARERIEALVDPNTPLLELSPLAAWRHVRRSAVGRHCDRYRPDPGA